MVELWWHISLQPIGVSASELNGLDDEDRLSQFCQTLNKVPIFNLYVSFSS